MLHLEESQASIQVFSDNLKINIAKHGKMIGLNIGITETMFMANFHIDSCTRGETLGGHVDQGPTYFLECCHENLSFCNLMLV